MGASEERPRVVCRAVNGTWEGPIASWEEPGKQKPRSCRTQELARSRAPENEQQKKAGLLNWEHRCSTSRDMWAGKAEEKKSALQRSPQVQKCARFKWLLHFAAATSWWPTTHPESSDPLPCRRGETPFTPVSADTDRVAKLLREYPPFVALPSRFSQMAKARPAS
jgi:hypothetical protein